MQSVSSFHSCGNMQKAVKALGIVLAAVCLLLLIAPHLTTLSVLTVVSERGTVVKWSKWDNGVWIEAYLPVSDQGLFHWGTCTYIWVSREAIFKHWDEQAKTWVYMSGSLTLYGKGGSARLYPVKSNETYRVYTYLVNFDTATSSYAGGYSGWEFSEWGKKGTVEIGRVILVFEDVTNIPETGLTVDTSRESQTETDQQTQSQTLPPEAKTVNVSSRIIETQWMLLAVLIIALTLFWYVRISGKK